MDFPNRKKTFLEKLDRSKKGEIDGLILPLVNKINQKEEYFTTSSCSGRVVLWKGSGKKNETEWIKVSHDLINQSFFKDIEKEKELVWLRVEPFIMHICCRDLDAADLLLSQAQQIFKKSSILSISNKIIVEIKGSEYLEIPLVKESEYIIEVDKLELLISLANKKLENNFRKIKRLDPHL